MDASEKVEILRDPWGIPDIYSKTDEGGFFGLGYAMAEDRAFQKHYAFRITEDRSAEVLGEKKKVNRLDGGAISHQTAQIYTQWAPMHDPDLGKNILPLANR